MNIDKFYQFVGSALKKVFNRTVKKPIQNFNIDNKAQRKIENPKAAPWHETTQKLIHEIKKESNFQHLEMKNENLLDRLKSVKVDSLENDMKIDGFDPISSNKRKLPTQRMGATLPYVFYKVENKTPGKITVVDVLDIILSHKKENAQPKDIAFKHNILEEDVKNILNYVDVFVAVDEDMKEIPLFVKKDDSQMETITSGQD